MRVSMPIGFIVVVLSFIDVNAALAGWFKNPVSKFAVMYHRTNLCVGVDRRVRPHVSIRFCYLMMSMLRLPGGSKILFPNLLSRIIEQISA
jgi:hypothetical protein